MADIDDDPYAALMRERFGRTSNWFSRPPMHLDADRIAADDARIGQARMNLILSEWDEDPDEPKDD